MKNKKSLVYIISVVLVEAAGFTVGMLTREGTQLYADFIIKPLLSPPGIVFPIAWTILYALMGIGIARVILCEPSASRSKGIKLFFVQFVLNLLWCFIFFGSMNFGLALVELICMLIATILMYRYFNKTDSIAARIQIPYILWLCFATYLNLGVAVLN